MRRTLLYAGARSVLVTLESVPDVETRHLMWKFYGRLARGSGSATALHDSQREVLAARRKAGAAHPFFLATYILVADPRESFVFSSPCDFFALGWVKVEIQGG
ncbi:MAG: CHAT domain-containing protein [Gemmataceae bacterium]